MAAVGLQDTHAKDVFDSGPVPPRISMLMCQSLGLEHFTCFWGLGLAAAGLPLARQLAATAPPEGVGGSELSVLRTGCYSRT